MSENTETVQNQDGIKQELFQEWINDDLKYLVFIKKENKIFHKIREKFQNNLELIELCREAIFDNDKLSKELVERIRDVERKLKEFK